MEKHKAIYPSPKTVGELRNALSGYEDSLDLLTTYDVFICREKGGPFKMEIKPA